MTMKLFRSLLAVGLLAMALVANRAEAATFAVTPGGTLTATVADFGGGNVLFDFQGTSFVEVYNPGFSGAVLLTGGPSPFGNLNLVFVDGLFSEFNALALDLLTLQIIGSQLIIDGGLNPLTPITDIPLSILSAFSSVRLTFDFLSSDPNTFPGATVSFLALGNVTGVPEPSSMALFGGGCALMLLVRKRLVRN